MRVHPIDILVIFTYVVGLALVGLHFGRKHSTTETYFMARRSIPSWALGISLLGTLITSVTFIAYPGAAYGGDWSLLVPGFLAVVILALVGTKIIPFYRQQVRMSAYEYFGKRFGRITRVYSSAAFALGHLSKMAFVFYLLSLTVNSITGWNIDRIILIVGAVTIVYTLHGGFEAVIWTESFKEFSFGPECSLCLWLCVSRLPAVRPRPSHFQRITISLALADGTPVCLR